MKDDNNLNEGEHDADAEFESVTRVAARFGVSTSTVRSWVHSGALRAISIITRGRRAKLLIEKASVEDLIRRFQVVPRGIEVSIPSS